MSKNPKHRPPNMRRIESMARHYVAAWETLIIRDELNRDKLYGGSEYLIKEHDLSNIDKLHMAIDELNLFIKYLHEGDNMELSDEQDSIIDWHEQRSEIYVPLSREPRGDRMLVYRIAAATFNNQLAIDQAGNEILGLEPSRLDEKPTTASALQRALSRPSGVEAIAQFEESCRKFTSV